MASLISSVGRKPDYISPTGTPAGRNHFTETTGKTLIRARLKSELPRSTGLIPDRMIFGAFRWQWWGLRDDYGFFATEEALKPVSTL